jgi:pimeloyl-ACP methyl ester carboxylesterase
MKPSVVFVHGAWMTPLCWEHMIPLFEAKGYKCLAPAWPYRDRPIDELRANPDPRLASLTVQAIVDHYAAIIGGLETPPILIGHSFGGLFVQMLLDRGLGRGGVVLDSAPPKGVFQFYPTVLRANMNVLLTPLFWNRIMHMSLNAFKYSFVNTLPENEQKAVYERYVVPETGRIFLQAATSMLHNATRVNFNNPNRPPLLMIAGAADHICPPAMNRANCQKYRAVSTAFQVFDNRPHWVIAWPEVASYTAEWVQRQTS